MAAFPLHTHTSVQLAIIWYVCTFPSCMNMKFPHTVNCAYMHDSVYIHYFYTFSCNPIYKHTYNMCNNHNYLCISLIRVPTWQSSHSRKGPLWELISKWSRPNRVLSNTSLFHLASTLWRLVLLYGIIQPFKHCVNLRCPPGQWCTIRTSSSSSISLSSLLIISSTNTFSQSALSSCFENVIFSNEDFLSVSFCDENEWALLYPCIWRSSDIHAKANVITCGLAISYPN